MRTQQQIAQLFDRAVREHQAGRLEQAAAAYHEVLQAQPNHPGALHLSGVIALHGGHLQAALSLIGRSLEFDRGNAAAHGNFGIALEQAGQLEQAIAAHRRSVELDPRSAEGFYSLGNTLKSAGQPLDAIAAYRQAIALRPNFSAAYNNCGVALKALGKYDDAIDHIRHAIALSPSSAPAHCNLAGALCAQDKLDEGIAAYRRAIQLNPNYAGALIDLGTALREIGKLDEAIDSYRRAISLSPDWADAHYKLSLALLLRGDFSEGWKAYEWRWKYKKFPSPARKFPQPQWAGQPLAGATLFVHAEQGLGDTLQFVRYLPLLDRSGNILVECPPPLVRLAKTLSGNLTIVSNAPHLAAFDFHAPMIHLPGMLGTTADSIPSSVPYLSADPQAALRWRERLEDGTGRMKVGLLWAGNPHYLSDAKRSIPLATLSPLASIPGIRFFSLQKGAAADQARTAPIGMELIDFTSELEDFADTAALIDALDLVISVDTAVAHLAGAMGKAVWTMIPFNPDWRWGRSGDDSAWYPTMRLFRQTARHDWSSVIQRVVRALAQLSSAIRST